MSSFVELSDEDPILEMVRYMHEDKPDEAGETAYEEDKRMLQEEPMSLLTNMFGFLRSQLLEGSTKLHDKDVEGCFHCIFLLLRRLDRELVPDNVESICSLICSDGDRTLLRCRVLSNFYTLMDFAPRCRAQIFLRLIKFCADNGQLDLVCPQLHNLPKWVQEWKCTEAQVRELFSLAISALHTMNMHQLAMDILIKHLETVEGCENDVVDQVLPQALTACIEAIKMPDLYQFDALLSLRAIQRLAEDVSNAPAIQLLKIFVQDKLEAFMTFADTNVKWLEQHGLDRAKCEEKMRVLSLATLCSTRDEVPYSMVASTLRIDEDAVEEWIIRGISAGLIEARLDQIKRVAVPVRSTQRQFVDSDWKRIGDSLRGWRTHVKAMLSNIEHVRNSDNVVVT